MTDHSSPGYRLPGGVDAIKEPIARAAGWASHLEPARRVFCMHIVDEAKVAVGRPIEFKHLLAA
jgi:hypothetical protein